MDETRTRKRIRRAVESRGFRIQSIEWERVCGGWTVIVDRPYVQSPRPGNDLGGLSAEEVLADIDFSLRPIETCGCYPDDRPRRHPLLPIKGDAERPLHEPGCRWYIAYRLRWWKD
jgi:hypothetical protein